MAPDTCICDLRHLEAGGYDPGCPQHDRDQVIAGELVRLSLGGRGPERPELTPPGYQVEQTMRLMLEEVASILEDITPWQLEVLRELPTWPRDTARVAHVPRITMRHLDALHELDRIRWRRGGRA